MTPLHTLVIAHFGEVLYLCGMTQASLDVILRLMDFHRHLWKWRNYCLCVPCHLSYSIKSLSFEESLVSNITQSLCVKFQI